MTLKDLAVGDKLRIVGFKNSNREYRRKLLIMGLTPGTEFTLTRVAPLGDPIEINVRGSSIILRKREADILKLEDVL
ncbi:MAG: ferrous iron transport protein A [Gammaproteobacteria bacterium]|nr:ferrous iron transport protein A [Gammaproteobacteria bacterium]